MSRVLVVEEDPGMRFVLCETLNEHGYEPVEASPESATAKAAELTVDLIVVSLSTAAYEQAPLYAALKADPRTKDIPLLLCTGRGIETVRRRLGERPPHLLFKPFTTEQFAGAVKTALA